MEHRCKNYSHVPELTIKYMKSIKVVMIDKPNVRVPSGEIILQRFLDNPKDLLVHISGKGRHPIFSRADVAVNTKSNPEANIVSTSPSSCCDEAEKIMSRRIYAKKKRREISPRYSRFACSRFNQSSSTRSRKDEDYDFRSRKRSNSRPYSRNRSESCFSRKSRISTSPSRRHGYHKLGSSNLNKRSCSPYPERRSSTKPSANRRENRSVTSPPRPTSRHDYRTKRRSRSKNSRSPSYTRYKDSNHRNKNYRRSSPSNEAHKRRKLDEPTTSEAPESECKEMPQYNFDYYGAPGFWIPQSIPPSRFMPRGVFPHHFGPPRGMVAPGPPYMFWPHPVHQFRPSKTWFRPKLAHPTGSRPTPTPNAPTVGCPNSVEHEEKQERKVDTTTYSENVDSTVPDSEV